jgi:hypothetical protein
MSKKVTIVAVAAICLLGLCVFTPQARADASPSGVLQYECPLTGCTGTVSGGATGPWSTTGIGLVLGAATNSNGGDEVGQNYTLVFNTASGAFSLTDATDGDFSLTGTIVNVSAVNLPLLNEVSLTMEVNITGGGAAGGNTFFTLGLSPLGGPGSIESATVSVFTPEPGSMLLLGTGLLTFGGVLRRRLFS